MIGFGPFLGSQNLFEWTDAATSPTAFHAESPYGAIADLAWAPDGGKVALALWCMDDARDVVLTAGKTDPESAGRVEIWDVPNRRLIHSLKGHRSFVHGATGLPRGSLGSPVARGCMSSSSS